MTEEFLRIKLSKDELKRIIFPENPVICRSCLKPRINKRLSVENFSEEHQAKICTVGKFHGPYNQNNGQNIVPNNAQLEIHHVEDVNVVHNIDPNFHQRANANIQNNQLNAQNYVTRNEFVEFKNEFVEFKESINDRFDRLERSIQALVGRNFKNNKSKK